MGTVVQTHGDAIRRHLKYSGAQEILSPLRSPRFSPPADLLSQRPSQQRLKYEDRVALSVCGRSPRPPPHPKFMSTCTLLVLLTLKPCTKNLQKLVLT